MQMGHAHADDEIYTLVKPWNRWPIEIEDFPSKKPPFIYWIFHGELLVITRVYMQMRHVHTQS
jgi:hypothetical protein